MSIFETSTSARGKNSTASNAAVLRRKRPFVVGRAVDVVEHRRRHVLLRELAELGDVVAALDTARRHATTPRGNERCIYATGSSSPPPRPALRVVLLEHDLQHLAAADGLAAFDGDLAGPQPQVQARLGQRHEDRGARRTWPSRPPSGAPRFHSAGSAPTRSASCPRPCPSRRSSRARSSRPANEASYRGSSVSCEPALQGGAHSTSRIPLGGSRPLARARPPLAFPSA